MMKERFFFVALPLMILWALSAWGFYDRGYWRGYWHGACVVTTINGNSYKGYCDLDPKRGQLP